MKIRQYSLIQLSCFFTFLLFIGCANIDQTPIESKKVNEDVRNLRIYQVMIAPYIDGDPKVGYGEGWGPSHHEGDLKGVIKALPYIKSLGMNAIWLTPIFDSNGHSRDNEKLASTGYYANNYFDIDPNFGTFSDAKKLVQTAHSLGMYVFLDGVFGHHGGNVKPSPSGLLPSKNTPVNYPESTAFYKEVATYWIDVLEIDGWRLDQAQEVPLEAWEEIRVAVEAKSLQRKAAGKEWGTLGYMFAELWQNEHIIQQQVYGDEDLRGLKSAFDFPMRYRLVQTLAIEESGKFSRSAKNLAEGFLTHRAYPDFAVPNLMMGNHDLLRFGDLLQRGKIADKSDKTYWLRHKAAFSFMTAYSGPLTFYYGEEYGDELENFAEKVITECWKNDLCDDHVARTPGRIDNFSAEEKDLIHYFTNLMTLREKFPALWMGKRIHLYSDENIYFDLKKDGLAQVLYALNISETEQKFALNASDLNGETLVNLMDQSQIILENGNFHLVLPPLSGHFWAVANAQQL